MSRVIHVISHTHWDREWYFTVDDSKVLMAKAFDEVVNSMEENPDIQYYLLDGQTSILEEYFALKPDRFTRVKKLIEDGRLITGPWYTQPDVFNIHGESIVRNLSIGMKQAESYGGGMKIGYLPDTFGYTAQMPLIYAECGIHRAIVRRGYDPKVVGSTEFYWEALDGAHRVLTAVQPFGYSMGHPRRGARYRDFKREQLHKETIPMIDKVKELSDTKNIMCTIGGDQVSIDANVEQFITEIRKEYNTDDSIIQSSLTAYFDAVEQEQAVERTYVGEFRDARYARVHKTIGSSRYDIKRKNFDAEQHLLRVSEVMNVICQKVGIYYDNENVERAWKLILESHAHDSMGGCNSDLTNKAVLERCEKAEHTSMGIFAQQARLLANNIDKKGHDSHFIVLNGSYLKNAEKSVHTLLTGTEAFKIYDENDMEIPFVITKQKAHKKPREIILTPEGEREVEVDAYYYENTITVTNMPINQLGYNTYYVKNIENSKAQSNLEKIETQTIENTVMQIKVVGNTLQFTDKKTRKILSDFLYFEDVADDGDLYDFSPLQGDEPIYIKNPERCEVFVSGMYQEMRLQYKAMLPEKINTERTMRVDTVKKMPINVTFLMTENDYVEMKIEMNNIVEDHRMRLIIDGQVASQIVHADQPFGIIARENKEIPENWAKNYEEYPANIEPFQSMLIQKDEERAVSIFAKGCKEYELLEGNKLAVSLFKGVGKLGKADLVFRPGRESGRDVDAPNGQLLGPLAFNIGILFTENQADATKEINNALERFLTPFASYQAQDVRRDFQQMDYFDIHVEKHPCPSTCTLVNDVAEDLLFSSLTMDGEEVLLRSTNISGRKIVVAIESLTTNPAAVYCNFVGDEEEIIPIKEVPTNSAFTIKL